MYDNPAHTIATQFMPIVYQYAIDHLGSAWLLRITALTTAVLGVGNLPSRSENCLTLS